METIINSVPEPLATAILTATFTGLLLLYFQKRIEKSFAEKLEEFKAKLQMSLIEHQIRFARSHEKTVEVLENVYREFHDYGSKFWMALFRLIGIVEPLAFVPEDFHITDAMRQKVREIQDQVGRPTFSQVSKELGNCLEKSNHTEMYVMENRIYLPAEIAHTIDDILSVPGQFFFFITFYMFPFIADNQPSQRVPDLNNFIQGLNERYKINLALIDENEPKIHLLILQIMDLTLHQRETLENLYKSVADAQ